MTGAKLGAMVMTTLTLLYVILLGQRGWMLLHENSAVAKTMGLLILVFPLFAFYGIFAELRFGVRTEKLAAIVEAEGKWPIRDIPMRPSGRPEKAAAEQVFDRIKEEAQKAPEDWHSWFNLSLGYDACGDRRRARAAMRKAIAMHRSEKN